MIIPAWQVVTWPAVIATIAEFRHAVTRLQHISTALNVDDEDAPRSGQVLWATDDARRLGIAWDWTSVTPSCIALSDPARLLSNVVLLGDQGRLVDDAARILYLNNAIHELTWHESLAAALDARARRESARVERAARHSAMASRAVGRL